MLSRCYFLNDRDKMDEEMKLEEFTFNLSKATALLIEEAKLPSHHSLVSWTKRKPGKKSKLLSILAELICDERICRHVAECFTPILAELVGRAIAKFDENSGNKELNATGFIHSLSILLKGYPYLFDTCGGFILNWKELLGEINAGNTPMMMEIFHNLMEFDCDTFFNIVDWNVVIDMACHGVDETAKSQALRCLLLASNYSDKSLLIPDQLYQEFKEGCFNNLIDPRIKRTPVSLTKKPSVPEPFDMEELHFTSSDIQTNLTAIANILIPCKSARKVQQNDNFILTESSFEALGGIILSLISSTPVLLEGELGTGKTVLLEYLASLVGRSQSPDILKLQLGDQTDSKSIIGMHVCAESPGEFKWQPGTLTQAVQNGSWLILEDIDSAPLDVISVLIPLMESRSLAVPGQSKIIKAAPGFQLFLTRRIQSSAGNRYHQTSPSSAIEHFCSVICLKSMSKEELQYIASNKHQHLVTIIPKLVDVYCMISSDLSLKSTQDTSLSDLPIDKRHCTSRDFFKWCQRIAERTVNSPLISINTDVFEEAFSCFCVPVANSGNRLILSLAIGTKFGMTKEKIEFYFARYKPQVQQTRTTFGIGRVFLPRVEEYDMKMLKISHNNYAFTRHSLNLLEQISLCVTHNEPVLLVGETGCGKSATIQYLANQCGRKFSAINMSQQSDVTDLLGGFKPVDLKQILAPLRDKFESLFVKTYSEKQNLKFLGHVHQCWAQKKWDVFLKVMGHCTKVALQRKGIKKDVKNSDSVIKAWKEFRIELKKVKSQMKEDHSLAFMFVEGSLVKAIRDGDWVLLDEINLATAETLECLSGLLESKSGSIVLVERGDAEPVRRNENFRLFACMNPATDIGKKDLPFGIRNRFSEIYVDELNDVSDLKVLVAHYLQDADVTSPLVDGIVKFYQLIQQEAREKLKDGTGHKPHYSLRTLCRALEYAVNNSNMMLPRAIYEGFCLSFLSQLDRSSHPVVEKMVRSNIFGQVANLSSILSQPIPAPGKADRYCKVEGYWIERGALPVQLQEEYVITTSVRENLRDLARVVSGRRYPVLLQGETSVGKTSLINYLAKNTGNQCVRINNHEHTDIQEYIGCYSADTNGKLVFKDGLLVDAMRKGYWIILDELNLAPTDVLEALNRLLDDNRELFIAETQETVKAHPQFVLFATQNPPGQYGGRKILSRAFRNRFVELHFDEIPSKELEIILHKRCHLPQSYCKKFVAVMRELQTRRKLSGIFAGKHGFITLRDLFRWAERYKQTPESTSKAKFYDWDQHIAEDGYMLLAGRCRKPQEEHLIKETIEKIMKRKIDLELLYGTGSLTTKALLKELDALTLSNFRHLVWTSNLRRMAVLVGRAIQFNEPLLLVGETGCGKTTVCQLFSHLRKSQLHSINCHMHTESSDFIGGLRPVRHRENEEELRLFEWCDGPLVCAMKEGSSLLIDEISLADDSVLERLNSVLETEKILVLAEKGGADESTNEEIEIIVAHEGFRLMATMNPGGDFGKKELSPALRNRFSEIWCPQSENREDFIKIIDHNIQVESSCKFGEMMVNFIEWFRKTEPGQRITISIRDMLCWADFINTVYNKQTNHRDIKSTDQLSPECAFIHGAFLVFIDSIGTGSSWSGPGFSLQEARSICLEFLKAQTGWSKDFTQSDIIWNDAGYFGIDPFFITRGPLPSNSAGNYSLKTKTTSENSLRLLRALQLPRPILLEGSPGVGKTSLVTAVAKVSGNELVRINLSEQTDVTDLFGADLPVEGGRGGEFAWRDGPFLKALKAGQWVVLDELNLASQSVLEGLNACFDHRAEVFVPELGKTFQVEHEKTRIFACQNPLSQGGGRKGLPKSFLNRFTKVYIDSLKDDDLEFIITALHPGFDKKILVKMIEFNAKLQYETMVSGEWGRKGSPWEFNIRDILRWCELINQHQKMESCDPAEFLNLIYEDRMRTRDDKKRVVELYYKVFEDAEVERKTMTRRTQFSIGENHVQIGHSILPRKGKNPDNWNTSRNELQLLRKQIPSVESVMKCVEMNWMAIVVGPKACGKTSIIESIAYLTGNTLNTLTMNSNMDTTELLGGFEQVNMNRSLAIVVKDLENVVNEMMRRCIKSSTEDQGLKFCNTLLNIKMKLRKLGDSDQTQESQDSEKSMAIFEEIETHLSTLGSMAKCDERLDIVKNNYKGLKKRFIEEGKSMHAKGQFEWVDGVLIETLKQGYWLLIENVNFCSPSVLDRLNGLLEPKGVLSVDERGVQNGEIPTVKPHPNFRLFLSMDPKYGEISRAMRNRGVEICVLGEGDGPFNHGRDDMQLISSVGLKQTHLKTKLQLVYEEFSRNDLHERVMVTDLVKLARLVVELKNRGFGDEEAMKRACVLCFDGKGSGPEYDEVDCFMGNSKVQEIIESEISSKYGMTEEVLVQHLTMANTILPSVYEYAENSMFSRIRRDVLFITHSLTDSANTDLILLGIRCFLERFSLQDLKYRLALVAEMQMSVADGDREILKRICSAFGGFCDSALFREISRQFDREDVSSEDLETLKSIPCNAHLSWTVIKKLFSNFSKDQDFQSSFASLTHRVEAMLDRMFEITKQQMVFEENEERAEKSLLAISKKCNSGMISHSSIPHPVVEVLHPFLAFLDAITEQCLQETNKTFTEEDFYNLMFALKWRDRFWHLCSMSVSDSSLRASFPKSLFSLHWRWIMDELIPVINNVMQDSDKKSIEKLHTIVEAVSSRLNSGLKEGWKPVAFQKFYEHASLFRIQEVYQVWDALISLQEKMNLHNRLKTVSKDDVYKPLDVNDTLKKSSVLMQYFERLHKYLGLIDLTGCEEDFAEFQAAVAEFARKESGPQPQNSLSMQIDENAEDLGHLSIELLALFGKTELFAWLSCLSAMKLVNHPSENSRNGRKLVRYFEKLNGFSQLMFYGDFWLMAALKLEIEDMACVTVERLPDYLVCWLRSHCNEVSQLKIHLKILAIQSTDCQLNEGRLLQEESKQFNLFSSSSAIVLNSILEKRVAKKTKSQSINAIDCFEWKISVKDIDETSQLLSTLKKYYWQHAGLIQQLPQKICSSILHDAVDMFDDVIDALTSQDALPDQQKIFNDDADRVQSLLLRLSEKTFSNIALPTEIKTVLHEVHLYLANWLDWSGKRVVDEAVGLMKKVELTGMISSSVGLLAFILHMPVSPFDLIEEAKLKTRYFENELQEIEGELSLRYDVEYHLSGAPRNPNESSGEVCHFTSNPTRVQLLLRRRNYLLSEIKALRKRIALRPEPSMYDDLLNNLNHFYKNIASPTSVMAILHEVTSLMNTQGQAGRTKIRDHVVNLKRKIEAWMTSTSHFIDQLKNNYCFYQDITLPITHSLNQMLNGFSLMLSLLQWYQHHRQNHVVSKDAADFSPSDVTTCLASFPLCSPIKLLLPREMTSLLLSNGFGTGIQAILENGLHLKRGMKPRLLHLALSHLIFDQLLCKRRETTTDSARNILDEFCKIWLQFAQEKELREAEQDSIYKFKSKSHCTDSDEAEVNEKQFKELFPSFNADFTDLMPIDSLDDSPDQDVNSPKDELPKEESADHSFVDFSAIHDAIRVFCDDGAECSDEIVIRNFMRSQQEAMQLSSLDVMRCDPLLDGNTASSNFLLISLLEKNLKDKNSMESVSFDIYHESNIFEVQKLIGLLKKFSSQLDELLNEFPEHPTLLQIKSIIERILSFPVNQPLMKFLTGLEILLKQSQEWEAYASSKVSLKNHLISLTQQIIEWRKLELRCWPRLLQVVEEKFTTQAKEWFLKIYSALIELLSKEDVETVKEKELAKMLQRFIESSSVGEFATRLDIVNILYTLMKDKCPDLATVHWNVYHYYKQFSVNINENIRKVKSPIEKDLKDYVKIARWKDINFWAVKQAAEKSHRTLHKFVRKYQELLILPAIDHFKLRNNELSENYGNAQLDKKRLSDTRRFRTSKDLALSLAEVKSSDEWLNNSSTLSLKLMKKCDKFMKQAKHTSMIETLDEFTGDIIANVKELQAVNTLTLPEEKRAQARKHLHARKRKALAALFKTLSTIGLSYRKGLALLQQDDVEEDVLSPVIEFNGAKDDGCELSLLSRDCHQYFFKCLARNSALNNAMTNPSKELTPQDIARCKGNSKHLFNVIQDQRKILKTLLDSYSNISSKIDVLKKITKPKDFSERKPSLLPLQDNSFQWIVKLKDMLDLTVFVMTQFRQLVKCCPETPILSSASPVHEDFLPAINNCSSDHELVQGVLKTVEKILERTVKSKEDIDRIIPGQDSVYLATWSHVETMENVVKCLESNSELYEEIERSFSSESVDPVHSTAKSVLMLKCQTRDLVKEFKDSKPFSFTSSDDNSSEEVSDFQDSAKHLFKSILVSVQELSKLTKERCEKANETGGKKENIEDESEEEEMDLDDGHLIPQLEKNFFKEIQILGSKSISFSLTTFFRKTKKLFDVEQHFGSEVFLLFPGMEQYLHVVEYFLEKLLYLHRTSCKLLFVLTGVFTDLANEGFCLPPDETEASGEGATEFEDIQGGGVGEGEGMKDVSNQIESEDQLEEASKEGQQKEEEKKEGQDIPEEEEGIEMTDDFDGRMHDVEPDKEGNESESGDEENDQDPDDKMGDLDGIDEEKLDEKFWGDSDDDDDDDEGSGKEEEKGPGADGQSESELVAKDENEGEQEGKEKSKNDLSKKDDGDDEFNELSADELNENESEDGNDNEDGKDNRDMSKPDDEKMEEFPNDLNFDQESNEDGDDQDEEMPNENEDGIDENIQDEADPSQDQTMEEEESKEEDENEGKEDSEEINDQEKPGEEPQMENSNEDNKSKEDSKDQKNNQDTSQPSDVQALNSAAENATGNDSSMEAQTTMEEQNEQQSQGTGSSQQVGEEGHDGISSVTKQETDGSKENKKNRRKDYNKSRQDRSLATEDERQLKRLKTTDSENASKEDKQDTVSADLYQHINDDESYDAHALDAATAEQALEQPDQKPRIEDSDQEMNSDDEEVAQNQNQQEENKSSSGTVDPRLHEEKPSVDENEVDMEKEVKDTEEPMGESNENKEEINSAFYTSQVALVMVQKLEVDNEALRHELELQLSSWAANRTEAPQDKTVAVDTWRKYENLTSSLSQQLCEQLRLVLEPTFASKLRGDYRTGKRLNMRKVIPYIASQFRKDKIWLRRTKKSRRQYQIMLAVDDSSSMADNHSKQLAFESLAVISNALTWLEAGELAVCSFGETTKLLHSFNEPFNEQAGAQVLHDFTFEQTKTKVALMLDTCSTFMTKERSNIQQKSSLRLDTSQLLLIVSDGRGIFLEGKEVVEKSVRRAREAGLFIVFIILDNPSNRDSVLDIKVPIFKKGGLIPEIKSYLEEFPFPFYLILRDINSLPVVLSDALRQWFELVTSMT